MRRTTPLLLAALALLPDPSAFAEASPDTGALAVTFEGMRSAKGVLRACLTRERGYYLKCEQDPAALKASVAAGKGAHLLFGAVPPGDYALLVLHDENDNAKVDMLLGIPREGIGFSRNPKVRFGPPSFEAVRFHVPAGASETDVKLQYFL